MKIQPLQASGGRMTMKKGTTIFLQVVSVTLAIGALAFMLWEPFIEGRNAHATLSQVYLNDPFLLYAYSASIFFFIAVYQTFVLLGYIGRNEVFSNHAASALRALKYCASAIVVTTAAPLAYLFIVRPGDDIAGGVAIGLFIIFVSAVIAANAAMHERIWQKAMDMKSENDLTI